MSHMDGGKKGPLRPIEEEESKLKKQHSGVFDLKDLNNDAENLTGAKATPPTAAPPVTPAPQPQAANRKARPGMLTLKTLGLDPEAQMAKQRELKRNAELGKEISKKVDDLLPHEPPKPPSRTRPRESSQ